MDRRRKKSVQAINYLASISNGTINRMKMVKLLWLADRYHLLKYGRTILKDKYYAMEHGPIQTDTLNISRHNVILSPYIDSYLIRERYEIKSIKEPDISLFSKSDLEILNKVWDTFGSLDQYALRDITHEYPEWKRFESVLNNPTTPASYPMEMVDFFEMPENKDRSMAAFFDIPNDVVFESKQTFSLRKKFEE